MIRYCDKCRCQVSWLIDQGRYVHIAPQDHDPVMLKLTVEAVSFVETLAANVINSKLDDGEFRAFVRNTLPIVKGRGD